MSEGTIFEKKTATLPEPTTPNLEPSAPLRSPLESTPRLNYIFKSLELLRANDQEENPQDWRELASQVAPYENSLEFVNNVREVVRDYVAKKVPILKNKIHTIADFDDTSLTDALAHGWYETLKKEDGDNVDIFKMKGERRGVLLSVLSHTVRRIEKKTIKNLLQTASEDQLKKIGLDPNLKNLTVDLLDISIHADPLFTRYFAFAKLGPEPNEEAQDKEVSGDGLSVQDGQLKTFRELFPHETQYLSKKFHELSEKDSNWVSIPGGKEFNQYLQSLSNYYGATDPSLAKQYREESNRIFKEVVMMGFPILLINASDNSIKTPYVDPELKVAISSPDVRIEESYWSTIQKSFANNLDKLDIQDDSDILLSQPIKSVVSMGGYGINTVFNGVAQAEPITIVYLDEQIRSYDKDFPKILEKFIANSYSLFSELTPEEARVQMERMSRTNTVMHEFSHWVLPEGLSSNNEFGEGTEYATMEELKAESLYRALIPTFIDEGVLSGTPEQWAAGLVGSSIQMLKDNMGDPGNDYFQAASYSLNNLFNTGVLTIVDKKIAIDDTDQFYAVMMQNAQEIISLHNDETLTLKQFETWQRERCAPNILTNELVNLFSQI